MTDPLDNFNNVQIKLSNDDNTQNVQKQQSSSLFSTLKGYVTLNSNDTDNSNENDPFISSTPKETSLFLSKVQNVFQVEQSYSKFLIVLFIGVCLLFLSLMFLPMVVFSPQKFVFMFSLGSFITIYSFIFYYGTNEFMKMIFCQERRMYTISFLASLGIGFYFMFKPTYYIIALLCSGLQMVVMVIFVLSFIPGGKNGIAFIINMMLAPLKNMINKN